MSVVCVGVQFEGSVPCPGLVCGIRRCHETIHELGKMEWMEAEEGGSKLEKETKAALLSSPRNPHSLLPSGMTSWGCGLVLKYVFNLVKESTAWKENIRVKGGGSPWRPKTRLNIQSGSSSTQSKIYRSFFNRFAVQEEVLLQVIRFLSYQFPANIAKGRFVLKSPGMAGLIVVQQMQPKHPDPRPQEGAGMEKEDQMYVNGNTSLWKNEPYLEGSAHFFPLLVRILILDLKKVIQLQNPLPVRILGENP